MALVFPGQVGAAAGVVTWLTLPARSWQQARYRYRFQLSHQGKQRIGEEKRMDIEETDIVVIGMGPGGEDAAGRLAEAGLHVTGVEARLVGGECPYWGCVPSKMMIRAANLLAEARRVPGMAGTSALSPDWCRGSPSPIPRSARWGSPRRKPASRDLPCTPASRSCHRQRAVGSTGPATTGSSSSSKTLAAAS